MISLLRSTRCTRRLRIGRYICVCECVCISARTCACVCMCQIQECSYTCTYHLDDVYEYVSSATILRDGFTSFARNNMFHSDLFIVRVANVSMPVCVSVDVDGFFVWLEQYFVLQPWLNKGSYPEQPCIPGSLECDLLFIFKLVFRKITV